MDRLTKLKLQPHNHNHRHQRHNNKHQLKQEEYLVAEVVSWVEAEAEVEEAALLNLLVEEQTLLNNSQHRQHLHQLMKH